MTLKLNQLNLRISTANGLYGATFKFGRGLFIIGADNTTGKSTCLQAILFALGLERMLSPKRQIPLAYVMTTRLCDSSQSLTCLNHMLH